MAHVLLTKSMSETKYNMTGSSWNELTVYLGTHGSVRIDPVQRVVLEQKWRRAASSAHDAKE